MTSPSVVFQWRLNFAMAEIASIGPNNDDVPEKDVDIGMLAKATVHGGQSAGKVLFVAIEVGQNFAGGASEPAIDGVVHSPILFHERFHPPIAWQPVQRAIVRTGVLHDMFQLE